jgi:uncharacterized SAM-dependent methyltransferase
MGSHRPRVWPINNHHHKHFFAKRMDFTMYLRTDVAQQMQRQMLDEAQEFRSAHRVSALNRARRRQDRAERQMRRARMDAHRLRRQLEAEL